MSYDSNYTEHPDLMGEIYEDAMNILRNEFGSDLLSDADLPETEWDMSIDEADDYVSQDLYDQIVKDFNVDPRD